MNQEERRQKRQDEFKHAAVVVTVFVLVLAVMIIGAAAALHKFLPKGTKEVKTPDTQSTEISDDTQTSQNGSDVAEPVVDPLDEQAAMLHELFPDAKNVGLLYCSAEANSQYQVDTVKAALEEMGYTCEYYAFSDSNDLATITTNAATNSDVIYVPTDNTVAANTEIVKNLCQPAKVPVIAGEEGICSGCGVATLSISYYDLGVATGKMAVKILTGEANVSEMPIEYAPQFTKKYNKTICDALEITVPDDYVAIEE